MKKGTKEEEKRGKWSWRKESRRKREMMILSSYTWPPCLWPGHVWRGHDWDRPLCLCAFNPPFLLSTQQWALSSNQQLLPLTKFPEQIKQHNSISGRVSSFQDLTKRLWENQSNRQPNRCKYRLLFSKRQIVSSSLNWGSEMKILHSKHLGNIVALQHYNKSKYYLGIRKVRKMTVEKTLFCTVFHAVRL